MVQHSPYTSPSQQKELHRLKFIQRTCLVLGLAFSIFGLIAMCTNTPEKTTKVAREMEESQENTTMGTTPSLSIDPYLTVFFQHNRI